MILKTQPFLYVSSLRGQRVLTMLVSLGAIFAAALYSLGNCSTFLLGGFENQEDQTGKAHVFVMRMSVQFLPIYSLLLALYLGGAGYYRCGDVLGDSSLAHFSGSLDAVLALGWSAWILLGMRWLRDVPKPHRTTMPSSWLSTLSLPGARKDSASRLGKFFWFILWLFLVLLLSTPSMAYAMVDSLPRQNTLIITSPNLLTTIHSLAVPIMLLVDLLLTPKLAALISERSALRRSMLLMAARSATMWLNATLCTIYLNEHCMRGWTRFWTVCNPLTEHYQNLNISLGEHQLLDPTNDLCLQNKNWWRSDACVRSIVETLGPLFVTKMIQRAFLQPVIVLVLWKLSKEIEGQLWLFPLAYFGIRSVKFRTSNSLDRAQQASLLVTLAEVLLLWSPLVPLLIPAVFMATWSNLIVFRMAKWKFNAKVPDLEDGETASMSRKYMHFSLGVLLIFQIWFALTSRMCGTSFVILAAVVYVCDSFSLTEHMARGMKFRGSEWDDGVQMVELRPGPSSEVFGA